jgi:hypothetical protein
MHAACREARILLEPMIWRPDCVRRTHGIEAATRLDPPVQGPEQFFAEAFFSGTGPVGRPSVRASGGQPAGTTGIRFQSVADMHVWRGDANDPKQNSWVIPA